MGLKDIFTESTVARYARDIKAAPRETILSRKMLLSAALYAMAGVPISESLLRQVMFRIDSARYLKMLHMS